MKKYVLTLLAIILLAGTSCQEKIDIEKEKEAIMAVIEEETNSFIDNDFDRLSNTFVQDETNIRLMAGKSSYTYHLGWENVSSYYKEFLEQDLSDYKNIKFEKTNYRIKVYNNSAWAAFDENREWDYEDEHIVSKAIGIRFLEKVDDEWKIVYLSVVDISSYEEEEIEEGEGETETEESE